MVSHRADRRPANNNIRTNRRNRPGEGLRLMLQRRRIADNIDDRVLQSIQLESDDSDSSVESIINDTISLSSEDDDATDTDLSGFLVSDEETDDGDYSDMQDTDSDELSESDMNTTHASNGIEIIGEVNNENEVEFEPVEEVDVTLPTVPADAANESVIQSAEHGDCPICFDDVSRDPVGCIYCRKFVGCRKCINRWYLTGKEKEKRNPVYKSDNHYACPLCRHEWGSMPEVESIFVLEFQ